MKTESRETLREIFYFAERIPDVFFYTSNEEKFLQARHIFNRSGLQLRHFKTHTEPYFEDYSKGRENLLRKAIEQIRRLTGGGSIFFVEDTSLRIEALSGSQDFPGLAVKEWFSRATFDHLDLELKRSGNNRRAIVKSDIAMSLPGLHRPVLLRAETCGIVAETAPDFLANGRYPWLTPKTFNGWFVPDGSVKRLGEMSFEESLSFDFRAKSLGAVLSKIEEYTAILNLPSGAFSRRRRVSLSGQLPLMPNGRRALIVIGKTCAGKTTFGEFAAERGLKWIEASSVVRSLREQSDAPLESTEAFARKLLATQGYDVVARRILRLLESDSDEPFVVTGFRALEEVELVRRELPQVEIVLVESSERTRFERYISRNRDGDGATLTEFRKKDQRQWDFGLLAVAEDFADVVIPNESGLSDYYEQIDGVLSKSSVASKETRVRYPSGRDANSQLLRCLEALKARDMVLNCNEISDETERSGKRIRFNNVNKILKRFPTLAQRIESDGENVRYRITDAGRTYLRMLGRATSQ